MYQPMIKSATLKQTFEMQRHTARLFVDCQAEGPLQYKYVLTVLPHGSKDPVLFVTSEFSDETMKFKDYGLPPYLLCLFRNDGHVNYGNEEDWGDLALFTRRALSIVGEELKEDQHGSAPDGKGRGAEAAPVVTADAGAPASTAHSTTAQAVIAELQRDPSKTPEIVMRLQRDNPALLTEVVQWIRSQKGTVQAVGTGSVAAASALDRTTRGASPKLRAVIEQLLRDPSKTAETAIRLQREDPALFAEVSQWLKQQGTGTDTPAEPSAPTSSPKKPWWQFWR